MFKVIGELKGTKAENTLPIINVVEDRLDFTKTAMVYLKLYPEGLVGYDRVNFIEDGEGNLYIGRATEKAGASISITGKVSHETMVDYVKSIANSVLITEEKVEYMSITWYKVVKFELERKAEEVIVKVEEPIVKVEKDIKPIEDTIEYIEDTIEPTQTEEVPFSF